MGDVLEATTLVFEALSPLDVPERQRVIRAVTVLLEEPSIATVALAGGGMRKPVPVPVRRVKVKAEKPSPKDRRPSPRSIRPSPKLDSDRATIMKIVDANPGCRQSVILEGVKGRNKNQIKRALYSLVYEGEIRVQGKTNSVRYFPNGQK